MANVQKIIDDATKNRYRFVCTPKEFVMKYGVINEEEYKHVQKYIVLCKDGMIRPR